jgi:hypothetical protein
MLATFRAFALITGSLENTFLPTTAAFSLQTPVPFSTCSIIPLKPQANMLVGVGLTRNIKNNLT